MTVKFIVYKTTNHVNGKIYIGVHRLDTTKPDDYYYGSGNAITNALKFYGNECFTRETLFEYDTPEEAYAKESEIVTIDFIKRTDNYNIRVGGFGGIHGEETKKLWSKNRRGFDSPNRRKAREFTVKKRRELGEFVKVVAINIETQEQREYQTIEDCAKDLKLVSSCVSRVCRGDQNRTQHKGWKFHTEKYGESLEPVNRPLKYINSINKGGYSVKVGNQYLGYRRDLQEAITLRDNFLATQLKGKRRNHDYH